jgi:hypothetical protein
VAQELHNQVPTSQLPRRQQMRAHVEACYRRAANYLRNVAALACVDNDDQAGAAVWSVAPLALRRAGAAV